MTYREPTGSPVPWAGLDLLSTAVLVLDDELVVRFANAAAENLFEHSKRQLCGRSVTALFGAAQPLLRAVEQARATNAAFTEQEVAAAPGGRARQHLSCTVTPLEGADTGLLLEVRQIDQQLRIAREERLAEQAQTNRELVRNLAHEIKNPLGGIRGAAQLLERELERPQQVEYTQVIIAEADRLQQLVNRLLTPHRVPSYRPVNVHEIAERVRSLVLAEFPDLSVHADYDTSLPDVVCDPEQILQAVLNIARNAAQALAGRGEVWLRTRVARSVTLARRHHRIALALQVEDNGPGVPEAIRERIFFPLVSGREGGSGLGLTIAQTFVSQHHGTIECESEPGRTVFTLLLPFEPNGTASPHP